MSNMKSFLSPASVPSQRNRKNRNHFTSILSNCRWSSAPTIQTIITPRSWQGVRHFAAWPLNEAAQSCFGRPDWLRACPCRIHGLNLTSRTSLRPVNI